MSTATGKKRALPSDGKGGEPNAQVHVSNQTHQQTLFCVKCKRMGSFWALSRHCAPRSSTCTLQEITAEIPYPAGTSPQTASGAATDLQDHDMEIFSNAMRSRVAADLADLRLDKLVPDSQVDQLK
eukprot:5613197-Pleurochrysis_carterae.AAC.1